MPLRKHWSWLARKPPKIVSTSTLSPLAFLPRARPFFLAPFYFVAPALHDHSLPRSWGRKWNLSSMAIGCLEAHNALWRHYSGWRQGGRQCLWDKRALRARRYYKPRVSTLREEWILCKQNIRPKPCSFLSSPTSPDWWLLFSSGFPSATRISRGLNIYSNLDPSSGCDHRWPKLTREGCNVLYIP